MPQQFENKNLLALPNSLQRSLQRVDNLLAQGEQAQSNGNYEVANAKTREALQIIASASPELGALLAAGQMGYRGYEVEIVERVDRYQVVERKFLGLNFGTEVINTPTITRRTVRGRLF